MPARAKVASLTALRTQTAKPLLWSRFLNLGSPERGLVTDDPHSGDALPVDDTAWDTGVSHCSNPCIATAPGSYSATD